MDGQRSGRPGSRRNVHNVAALATIVGAIIAVIGVGVAVVAIVIAHTDAGAAGGRVAPATSPSPTLASSTPQDTSAPPTISPSITMTPSPARPTLPTQATPTPPAERIERIVIEIDDQNSHKIGPGEYQAPDSGKLFLQYWYKTYTNFGELDSDDCTVVARVVNTKTNELAVAPTSTASCTWDGAIWMRNLERGSYQISVHVRTSSGAEQTGKLNFLVR